jgi:large subunit ribosomal protein L19
VLLSGVGRPARARLARLEPRADGATQSSTEPQPHAAQGCPTVNVLDQVAADQIRTDLPDLAAGDTVRVAARVVEGGKERVQVFEGTVMRLRGGGITRSITVRKIASGVGVERTFKVNSPRIDKIDVVRHGQVRRAQLYFLRKRIGKAATLRERRTRQ